MTAYSRPAHDAMQATSARAFLARATLSDQSGRFFLVQSQAALRKLAALPADWDGAGSAKPSPNAIANASARLPELIRVIGGGLTWREPHVSADEAGDVSFEWWQGNRKVTFYFGAESMLVVKVWGANIATEMEDQPIHHVSEFGEVWTWLNGKRA